MTFSGAFRPLTRDWMSGIILIFPSPTPALTLRRASDDSVQCDVGLPLLDFTIKVPYESGHPKEDAADLQGCRTNDIEGLQAVEEGGAAA